MQRNISYYQGAAYVYKNRVDNWSNRDSFPVYTAELSQ
jgi:hypothetical protein